MLNYRVDPQEVKKEKEKLMEQIQSRSKTPSHSQQSLFLKGAIIALSVLLFLKLVGYFLQ